MRLLETTRLITSALARIKDLPRLLKIKAGRMNGVWLGVEVVTDIAFGG
jgi:hypothetical protein